MDRWGAAARRTWVSGSLLLLLALAASPADGQTFLPDPVDRPAFAIHLEKPFLPDVLDIAPFSSILEADALFPLGSTTLQVGLPTAFAGSGLVDGTSVYVGNVRASLLFGGAGALSGFVGITLPTASNVAGPDFAVLVGALPWRGEREKWVDDSYAVTGAFQPWWPVSQGRLGLRFGGAAFVPTDFDQLNVDARVAGWANVRAGSAALKADLATSYMVTSDDGFGSQFSAYLDLGAALVETPARPGLFLRIPLDGESRDLHDLSMGVEVGF
jgi:hypothetical protein